jgi:glutamate dehydrogenase/leucine dehydrogenase
MLPDILCNSDGITISYSEWPKGKRREFWDLREADTKRQRRMLSA